jgi:hypothetical protein
MRIREICADRVHCLAKNGKDVEHFWPGVGEFLRNSIR